MKKQPKHKITFTTALLEGDACVVQNYRRKQKWEDGKVIHVSAGVNKNKEVRVVYYVLLDRRSAPTMRRPEGRPLRLTVGPGAIVKR